MPALDTLGAILKRCLIPIVALTLLLAPNHDPAAAQSIEPPTDPLLRMKPPTSALDSRLYERAVRAVSSRALPESRDQAAADLVDVTIYAQPGRVADAMSAVANLGGQAGASYRDLLDAQVPASALMMLAQSPAVLRLESPLPPHPLRVGEGVNLIGAGRWHESGLTGAGVRVGIIDVGFQGYYARLGTDLPLWVNIDCTARPLENGEYHGTAVAEIVHSVAPGAELFLARVDTPAELGNAVSCLANKGVTVINHSVGWMYHGPGDGTGIVNAIVDDAVRAGIFWANSAGNAAQKHWAGTWRDVDSDGYLEFLPGSEVLPLSLSYGDLLIIGLRWNDPWGGSCNDYDLLLFDNYFRLVTGSFGLQDCSASSQPFERLSLYVPWSGTYYLAVGRYNASGASSFDLISFQANFPTSYQVSSNSLLHPADSKSAGMASVGAVPWYYPLLLESFSSRGPTTDGRIKPDLVAPDGVTTSVYGASGFDGTSASAPHVAGAAALLRQADPSRSPSALKALLMAGAYDLGAVGADNLYGSGLLQLGSPQDPTPTLTATNTPTASASPTQTPTSTPTQSPTSTATDMATSTPTATNTATDTATATPTDTPTSTVTATATHTIVPSESPTSIAVPSIVPTPMASATATAIETSTATLTPTVTQTAAFTPTFGETPTPTRTATVSHTATVAPSTPTRTATPSVIATSTPVRLVDIPTNVPTVAPILLTVLPSTIPTPHSAAGGVSHLIPHAPDGDDTAVAVVTPGAGSPFEMSLTVPAPRAGETPTGIRVQPLATVPANAALPAGVSVAKVVEIDVFDPNTGELVHQHDRPLELVVRLDAIERALCSVDPGRVALLHVDAAGNVTRVPIARLDCAAGILVARLTQTSSYAVATLSSPSVVPFRVYVPAASRSGR